LFARTCIIGYLAYAVWVFATDDIRLVTLVSALLFILMVVIPHRKLRGGVLPISMFLSVTFLSNALFNPGRIVYEMGPLLITEEGLRLATVRTLRVFLLIAGAKFLTVVITLEEAIVALGSLLSPMERLKIPVGSLFRTMALAVSMLPVIRDRIAEEYSMRTENMEDRDITAKVSVVFRFLLPLFFRSISDPESITGKKERPEG